MFNRVDDSKHSTPKTIPAEKINLVAKICDDISTNLTNPRLTLEECEKTANFLNGNLETLQQAHSANPDPADTFMVTQLATLAKEKLEHKDFREYKTLGKMQTQLETLASLFTALDLEAEEAQASKLQAALNASASLAHPPKPSATAVTNQIKEAKEITLLADLKNQVTAADSVAQPKVGIQALDAGSLQFLIDHGLAGLAPPKLERQKDYEFDLVANKKQMTDLFERGAFSTALTELKKHIKDGVYTSYWTKEFCLHLTDLLKKATATPESRSKIKEEELLSFIEIQTLSSAAVQIHAKSPSQPEDDPYLPTVTKPKLDEGKWELTPPPGGIGVPRNSIVAVHTFGQFGNMAHQRPDADLQTAMAHSAAEQEDMELQKAIMLSMGLPG